VYVVEYESAYPDGAPATITAQLVVPTAPARGADRDLYLFAPGSTGLLDQCRPSREHILGINWGQYRAHTLAFAGQGYVGLLPDYMGMGDPERFQLFFHADAGAMMVLDGVRAARHALNTLEERPVDQIFLAGFSQGGHAAFAAADNRRKYAPDVAIDGIIGYGPTTDMYALISEFVVVAPLVAYTFRERYGSHRFDPAVMLQDRWLDTLDHDVTRQCIGGIQRYYPWTPDGLFRPAFAAALRDRRVAEEYPEIAAVLDEHTVGLSGHGVPSLIVQGTDDIVVFPDSQTEFVLDLRAAGSDVRYYIYQDERHDVRQAAFYDVLDWMKEHT
jgi:dienelactone hydrolase